MTKDINLENVIGYIVNMSTELERVKAEKIRSENTVTSLMGAASVSLDQIVDQKLAEFGRKELRKLVREHYPVGDTSFEEWAAQNIASSFSRYVPQNMSADEVVHALHDYLADLYKKKKAEEAAEKAEDK